MGDTNKASTKKEKKDEPFFIQHSPDHTELTYTYPVKSPASVGVKRGDSFDHLSDNINSLRYYADQLLEKPALGYNFYFKNGTCGDDSVKECIDKTRYIYVRNIPTGNIPCSGGLNSKLYGFVPGIFQDIMDVNPLNLGMALAGEGLLSDKCIKEPRMVGSPDKNRMVTVCSPPEHSVPCLTEFYDNIDSKKDHGRIDDNGSRETEARLKRSVDNLIIACVMILIIVLIKKLLLK